MDDIEILIIELTNVQKENGWYCKFTVSLQYFVNFNPASCPWHMIIIGINNIWVHSGFLLHIFIFHTDPRFKGVIELVNLFYGTLSTELDTIPCGLELFSIVENELFIQLNICDGFHHQFRPVFLLPVENNCLKVILEWLINLPKLFMWWKL